MWRPESFESAKRTHRGRVRAENQDAVLDRPDLAFWAVADGMGGHRAGAFSANFVLEYLESWAEGAPSRQLSDLSEAILASHCELQGRLRGEGGTTLVAVSMLDGLANIHWAGDSRAYLIRDGLLQQLTRDHSVVQRLLDAGLIDETVAHTHPQASVITSALGIAGDPEVATISVALRARDRLLLCSDGLSRSLGPMDAAGGLPLDALADRMLTGALQRDGSDNISLVLIEST